ncbi:MAG TPA: STAS domain-containing protein [Tepidisphaeraceae bacterium]|nr:STAS domain-containing protein [Tepidisphaeraceae bacterium]
MSVKCEEYSQVCVMEVTGDFLADTASAARKALEQHVEQRQIVDFVVDFQKCGFIDSDGLEALLWMKRKCEELFGRIKFVNLDENCRKILEITRLEHDFECQADLPTALKTMR